MKQQISANIITLNEEKNIEAAMVSAQKVCDEVIVVDSESSDKTCEIARSLGAKVIVQPYLGDGPQKNVAAKYAKNEWILSLDADERLDENAIDAILKLNLDVKTIEAYTFSRKTFIGKHFIKLWYPDRVIRLYNKNTCAFSTLGGHDRVESKSIQTLQGDLLHYSYENYSDMVGAVQKFAARGARIYFEKGKRVGPAAPFLHGLTAFFRAFVSRGGVFHGRHGWNVSIISGFNTYMKYTILLEMQEHDRTK